MVIPIGHRNGAVAALVAWFGIGACSPPQRPTPKATTQAAPPSGAKRALIAAPPATTVAGLKFRSLMPSYWAYYAAGHPTGRPSLPLATRRRMFKARVVAAYPGAFAPGVLAYPKTNAAAELDTRIDAFLATEKEHEPALRKLTAEIATQLPGAVATFRAALPTFTPANDVVVSLSLGSFDGAGRQVDGKLALLFGLDKIATIHGATADLKPLFHHELFHLHHVAQAPKADMAKQELYLALWLEGLAVYVAKTLNPKASLNDLVLTQKMVSFVDANLAAEAAAMKQVMTSGDETLYQDYFLGRGKPRAGAPKRRAYYLGYLVAQTIAQKSGRDLEALSRLWGDDLKEEVAQALDALAAR